MRGAPTQAMPCMERGRPRHRSQSLACQRQPLPPHMPAAPPPSPVRRSHAPPLWPSWCSAMDPACTSPLLRCQCRRHSLSPGPACWPCCLSDACSSCCWASWSGLCRRSCSAAPGWCCSSVRRHQQRQQQAAASAQPPRQRHLPRSLQAPPGEGNQHASPLSQGLAGEQAGPLQLAPCHWLTTLGSTSGWQHCEPVGLL